MVRGKADKIDAKRIALYAYEKMERLVANKKSSENITMIKHLLSLRQCIMEHRAGYKASIKEQSEMLPKKEAEVLLKCQKKIIKCPDTEIDYIEIDIKTLITADTELKKQYELITTIKGVGANYP